MASRTTTKKAAPKKTAPTKKAAPKPKAVATKKKAPKKKAAAKPNAAATKKKAAPKKKPAKKAASADTVSAAEQIERKIASLGDWRGERLAEIRALIHEVDPGVVEEWKWMGTPVWSHDGMYALANAHKDKVKLTFFHGAKLRDDGKLFNAGLGGNKWRAIDFRKGDAIDPAALGALLREAVEYNTTHAVPKSKGSTATGKPKKKASKKTGTKRAAAKPKLLSGDNPQIAKADGDAPVQAYIAAIPGWKRDVARRVDALVERTVPNVRKAVRWNSPFYGVDGGQGWFLSFHCFEKYVKVTFFRGTSLRPIPPGESKVEGTRYLDIRQDDEHGDELVASWIRQASELPGWVP